MNLSRFDTLVCSILAGLLVTTGLLAWQTDRQGVSIISRSPAPGTKDVSTKSSIQVTFDRPMDIARFGTQSDSALPLPLSIQPPVRGAVRWRQKSLSFVPSAPLEPEQLYTVTVEEELRGLQGRSLQGELRWQFSTRHVSLLYLATDTDDVMQLYTIDPATKLSRKFTQSPSDVIEYALSPDASTLVYRVSASAGGSELWISDMVERKHTRLLRCERERCVHVAWRPDSSRLIYERIAPDRQEGRLWWLEAESGDTVPVFDDPEAFGSFPACSPDGTWLSYFEPLQREFRLYNLQDGRSVALPNQMGEPPAWHPQQNTLVISDILFQGEQKVMHLFLVNPEKETVEELNEDLGLVEDWSPRWSPDGEWLVHLRRFAGEKMGAQLVIMQPGAPELSFQTDEALYEHASPVWSPDGRYVAFQRSPLRDRTALSEIWQTDVTNGQTQKLVSPGKKAAWLP